MLTPPTKSMGTRASRNALMTPRWAKPRAPPPDRTSPTPAPGQEPREPAEIRAVDDVVMLDHRRCAQPSRGGACFNAFIMHQGKLDSRAAGQGRIGEAAWPGRLLCAGRGEQQDHVRLAATLPRPTRGARIRDIHHIVIQLFDAIEPSGGVGARPRVPHQLRAAGTGVFGDPTGGEIRHVDFEAIGAQ